MNTITVGAYQAKTNLAQLLAQVAQGTEIIITRHEKPVARLSPLAAPVPLGRAEALRRIAAIAAQTKSGPESAKELIVAGRHS